MSKILAKDFLWENYDGEVEGHSINHYWSIEISARPTRKDIRWGAQDTNVRTWAVYRDYREVAQGEADGVRACKKAALEALNRLVALDEALKEN